MNYRCTLAPVKRNIYAAPRHVPLSKHYRRMTYGLAHMAKSTMLPRQTYFSVALHSFRHQRFIVGERNGKRADYFYPRINVSPTLFIRSKRKGNRKKIWITISAEVIKMCIWSFQNFIDEKLKIVRAIFIKNNNNEKDKVFFSSITSFFGKKQNFLAYVLNTFNAKEKEKKRI